jgi:hypothetical protein
MKAEFATSSGSLDSVRVSEGSPANQDCSHSISAAIFKNGATLNESSPAAEQGLAGAVAKASPFQGKTIDLKEEDETDKQQQIQVVSPSLETGLVSMEIDFRQLENGCQLELVEDPVDPSKTKLAVFNDGEVQLVSKYEYRGNIFVPLARQSDGLGDILLPQAPNPYLSTEEILSRILHLLKSCLALAANYLGVLAAFVLYSWFADRLQPPVYLLITGPSQAGKITLLEAMRLLCRRSILVGDITAAAILDACSRFTPTLLIDENEWEGDRSSRNLRKHLRTGTSRQLLAKHLHKTQKSFGAKILSSPELPEDPALRSRCVHIPMFETDRVDLRKPWDLEIVKEADGLQASLLRLRLEKYGSIAWRLVPGAERLRPRSRDLLGSLSAALPKESAAEKSLLEFFRDVHNPSTRNLLSPAQQAVTAGLFEFVHLYPDASAFQVGKIAEIANKDLRASGERFKLADRKLTGILDSLGFGEIVRSSRGSLRALEREGVQKIHKLAWDHNITILGLQDLKEKVRGCKLCRSRFSKTPTRTGTSADGMPPQGHPDH